MTAREEPLLEAPVFRESTLVPSVLKRRYARLYTYASPTVSHSLRGERAAGHFAGSYKAAILPVTVGRPNLVCGAAPASVLWLPVTTLLHLQTRSYGARACLSGPFGQGTLV